MGQNERNVSLRIVRPGDRPPAGVVPCIELPDFKGGLEEVFRWAEQLFADASKSDNRRGITRSSRCAVVLLPQHMFIPDDDVERLRAVGLVALHAPEKYWSAAPELKDDVLQAFIRHTANPAGRAEAGNVREATSRLIEALESTAFSLDADGRTELLRRMNREYDRGKAEID
jgi:hypothetical protein